MQTYGEYGQFVTPEPVCQMMARMTVGEVEEAGDCTLPKRVLDPACGSGRMLLGVAELQPQWELFGQDIDFRCVRMTAINLALRNLYGYVLWGDTLRDEVKLIYRTGFNGISVIRYGRPGELASLAEVQGSDSGEPARPTADTSGSPTQEAPPPEDLPSRQLRLF